MGHNHRYTASKAGRYKLTVMGAEDGDALPGSPFTVDVAVRWPPKLFLNHNWSAQLCMTSQLLAFCTSGT